jgi:hypothetical protein
MKHEKSPEYLLKRISHWEWAKRQLPDCETLQQTAKYVIRKYEDKLSEIEKQNQP